MLEKTHFLPVINELKCILSKQKNKKTELTFILKYV